MRELGIPLPLKRAFNARSRVAHGSETEWLPNTVATGIVDLDKVGNVMYKKVIGSSACQRRKVRSMMLDRGRGFTLIELLVVIAMI